jgi:hypothetical protein
VEDYLFIIVQNDVIARCHESTQALCSVLQPVLPASDRRHQYKGEDGHDARVMPYEYEEITSDDKGTEGTGASYRNEGCAASKGERVGVHHLVHGWIQQNQPNKVSFTFRTKIVI